MESQVKEVLKNVAEVELVYKSKVKASLRPVVKQSHEAYEVFMTIWDKGKIELCEEFKVLFLNQSNKVLAVYEISRGGITGTVADLRLIYATALRICANQIIMAHNHPSGNLRPSLPDKDLTLKAKQGGALLDIRMLDHLIVHPEGYFSFADEGLL
jgi:DNA repair protein RadC